MASRKKASSPLPSSSTTTEIVLSGEVTVGALGELRAQALRVLDGGGLVKVTTRELTYLDAASLQFIWALRRECEARDQPLYIEPPSESVMRDAERLGMQGVFVNQGLL